MLKLLAPKDLRPSVPPIQPAQREIQIHLVLGQAQILPLPRIIGRRVQGVRIGSCEVEELGRVGHEAQAVIFPGDPGEGGEVVVPVGEDGGGGAGGERVEGGAGAEGL